MVDSPNNPATYPTLLSRFPNNSGWQISITEQMDTSYKLAT